MTKQAQTINGRCLWRLKTTNETRAESDNRKLCRPTFSMPKMLRLHDFCGNAKRTSFYRPKPSASTESPCRSKCSQSPADLFFQSGTFHPGLIGDFNDGVAAS